MSTLQDAGASALMAVILAGALTFITMAVFENRAVAELSHDQSTINKVDIKNHKQIDNERFERILDKLEDLEQHQLRIEDKIESLR
jgi:hypothetical protein